MKQIFIHNQINKIWVHEMWLKSGWKSRRCGKKWLKWFYKTFGEFFFNSKNFWIYSSTILITNLKYNIIQIIFSNNQNILYTIVVSNPYYDNNSLFFIKKYNYFYVKIIDRICSFVPKKQENMKIIKEKKLLKFRAR